MKDGKAFEAEVAVLLRASGYTVRTEELVGSKRADLIAETIAFGKRQVYAVECKDYSGKLSRELVARILTEYGDLLQQALVDGLLLVTRNGLSANAASFVRNSRTCSHQTLAELERSVIDFSSYLTHLVTSYEEDHLSNYYVPPRTLSGDDLLRLVLDWVGSDSIRPLAVLGSYGMGKTTFSRHVAATLAQRALVDAAARIPILIPLGLISAEQTLSGLLGRQFTAIHNLRQYSFSAFNTLNRLGKLIILLDGFDEMKHTLSWHEFRYNFQQLLQLVVPNSRVVVLGRPTAFISDAEHIYILHGRYHRDGQEFHIPNWPDFIELELAPFDNEQITMFLDGYFENLKYEGDQQLKNGKRRQSEERTKQLTQGMSSKHIRDLARRPVQLAMLAEILPEWRGDFSTLTVATLYDHFIDIMIERELDKVARQRFLSDDRRRFAREVAWWLWTQKGGTGLTPDVIPDELIQQFATENDNLEAVRRDLTSACFLEKKLGGALYFPHRSFQEFLVAEKIYAMMDDGEKALSITSVPLTGEVATFISGIADGKVLVRWLGRLGTFRGTATRVLFTVLAENLQVRQIVTELTTETEIHGDIAHAAKRGNPWYSLLRILLAQKQVESLQSHRSTINYFLSNITPNSGYNSAVFNFFCAVAIAGICHDRKNRELSRVLEDGTDRLGAIVSARMARDKADEYQSYSETDEESYAEELQEKLEGSYDERLRSRHGALQPRMGYNRDVRKRPQKFIQNADLQGTGAISIAVLLGQAAQDLRGHAMLEEWVDSRADLVSEFTLPGFVTLERRARQQSDTPLNEQEDVGRTRKGTQDKTIKRDRRRNR